MGGVSLPGGGGKRALDFEINLVPFIDLLSCCISFLLITAAWSQLARIETNQKADPPGSTRQDNSKRNRVDIQIDAAGFKLMVPGDDVPVNIPRKGTDYDWKGLETRLMAVRAKFPAVTNVVVAGMDRVPYKEMVHAMDVCVKLGLKDMSLGATGPEAGDAPAPAGG